MESFCTRIQDIASSYDMKLSTLLRYCNIPYSTYQSLSYQKTSPSIATLQKVIKTFPDIRFEWLATGNGEMFIPDNSESDIKNNPDYIALKKQVEILSNRLIDKERYILKLELELATCKKNE